jgi:hypothetical protein
MAKLDLATRIYVSVEAYVAHALKVAKFDVTIDKTILQYFSRQDCRRDLEGGRHR